MYIATVPNRNSSPTILLRQSYREGGKVKTRTLLNITNWDSKQRDGFTALLKGGTLDKIDVNECSSDRGFGLLYVFKQALKESGIGKILGKSQDAKLIEIMLYARIAHQGSRLGAVRWAKQQATEEILGIKDFSEDCLYQALEWAAEHQEEFENKLVEEHRSKTNKPLGLVLYDVTSSYFEGECNELAGYGYNRDKKKGKKQIVIGLLTDADGEPLAVKVYKGNTNDGTTVQDQITALQSRFKISDVVFVGDRGMLKSSNKEILFDVQYKYTTALSDPQIRKLLSTGRLQLGLFDETVSEVIIGNKRLVLRCNPFTKKKEEFRREDKLSCLRKQVENRNKYLQDAPRAKESTAVARLTRWAKKHKLSSFVTFQVDQRVISLVLDQDKKTQDGLLDGCYVIETNVSSNSFSSQQVHDRYMDLQKVERDFRTLKTAHLELRPIFLRKQVRTRGHVFIAMLALKLVRYMNSVLKTIDTSLEDALLILGRFCLLRYQLKDSSTFYLPKPDDSQKAILSAFGLTPPTQL